MEGEGCNIHGTPTVIDYGIGVGAGAGAGASWFPTLLWPN